MGLIVGVIGLVLNACISGAVGLCGPFFSLLAGAVAGFFAAQQEKLGNKSDGARAGATAGAIAGGLIIIGQLIGGVAALFLLQTNGAQLPIGNIPTPADGASTQVIYYLTGAGTSLCFGIVGAALAAAAGAGTGYLGTNAQSNPTSFHTPS
jgi:hypothetical protein